MTGRLHRVGLRSTLPVGEPMGEDVGRRAPPGDIDGVGRLVRASLRVGLGAPARGPRAPALEGIRAWFGDGLPLTDSHRLRADGLERGAAGVVWRQSRMLAVGL